MEGNWVVLCCTESVLRGEARAAGARSTCRRRAPRRAGCIRTHRATGTRCRRLLSSGGSGSGSESDGKGSGWVRCGKQNSSSDRESPHLNVAIRDVTASQRA